MRRRREYINIHGRKGGRGLRPLLLIPKVLGMGLLLGSYAAATMLWLEFRWGEPATPWPVHAVSMLFRRLIVPAVLATLLFGVLLFLQHPRVFIARRWLQAKLVIAAGLLGVHFVARSSFLAVKAACLEEGATPAAVRTSLSAGRFTSSLLLGLVAMILLIFIGRHKPRLGQHPRPAPSIDDHPPDQAT